MNRSIVITVASVALALGLVLAQSPQTHAQSGSPAPPAGKSLSATLQVYVFPGAGQTPERQSIDESECYTWAVQNTGTDPFELATTTDQKKAEAQESAKRVGQATEGAGARGAVGGAAAGALIGEIASDDAGKGAAYGAAAGLIAGRRRSSAARGQAQTQATRASQEADAEAARQTEAFRKAFSVCLEAKDYMVKY